MQNELIKELQYTEVLFRMDEVTFVFISALRDSRRA